MAKKIRIGYNQISGSIYINNKGEDFSRNNNVSYVSQFISKDIRGIETGLELAIVELGSQLGKRKVDLSFDKFYEINQSKIEDWVDTYVKRSKSIEFS